MSRELIPAVAKPWASKGIHGELFCLKLAGDTLYTAGADHIARAWDVKKGKVKKEFKGHTDIVWCMTIVDGVLYTGSADKTVKAWNISKGTELNSFVGHKKPVFCLEVRDKTLFSGSEDKTVYKHNEDTGSVMVYKGHKGTVLCMQLVGNILYTGSCDYSVKAWDIEKDQFIHSYKGHLDYIYCLKVVDGVIYTGSRDGTAKAFDAQTEECLHTFTGHTSRLACLEVAHGTLLTGSGDGTTRAWDIKTGGCKHIFEGHEHTVLCMLVVGNLLYTGAADFMIYVWNIFTGQLIGECKGHSNWVLQLQSDNETTLFSSCRDGTVRAWDISAQLAAAPQSAPAVDDRPVVRVFLPDNTHRALIIEKAANVQRLLEVARSKLGDQLPGIEWKLFAGTNAGGYRQCSPTDIVMNIRKTWTSADHRFVLVGEGQSPPTATEAASPRVAAQRSVTPTSSSLSGQKHDAGGGGSVSSAEVEALKKQNAQLQAALRQAQTSGGAGGNPQAEADLIRVQAQLETLQSDLKEKEVRAAKQLADAQRDANARIADLEKEVAAQKEISKSSMGDKIAAVEKKYEDQISSMKATHEAKVSSVTSEAMKVEEELKSVKKELSVTKEKLAVSVGQVEMLTKQVASLTEKNKELEVVAGEAAEHKARNLELEKSTADALTEQERLRQTFVKEQKLRIKYYNMVEDMKGKIRVYARARPMSSKELTEGHTEITESPDEQTLIVHHPVKDREFQFTRVFMPQHSQADVYEDTRHLIRSALDGFNVCIFAYGQTGSGKTYTMSGDSSAPGITPRAITDLYRLMGEDSKNFEYELSIEMLELYNDNLCDLLLDPKLATKPPKLDIHKDGAGTVSVSGITTRQIPDESTLHATMNEGLGRRHVSSTNMNDQSSRSHLVTTILIRSKNKHNGLVNSGKLSLVDLAGSERVSKSGATADRLKEAQSINKSLTALGGVIAALCSDPSAHIPYRNNKLTFLMSDSVGGNAKTLMFVNISPASYNLDETLNSLGYAARVKEIRNDVQKNVETKEIQRLKKIIADLKSS